MGVLYLRVEVEEGVDAHAQLSFDLFAGAFQHVHGHVGFVAVGEFERGVLHLGDFALGQEAQSVDQSQICHEDHLIFCGAEFAGRPVASTLLQS
jgi:hypothetical protein